MLTTHSFSCSGVRARAYCQGQDRHQWSLCHSSGHQLSLSPTTSTYVWLYRWVRLRGGRRLSHKSLTPSGTKSSNCKFPLNHHSSESCFSSIMFMFSVDQLWCSECHNSSDRIKTCQSAGFMMSPGYVRGLISRVCTVQKEQLAQDCARPLALSDIRKEQLAQDCTRPLALLNIWNCHLPIIRRGFRVLNNDVLSCFRDHYVKSADKRASRSWLLFLVS